MCSLDKIPFRNSLSSIPTSPIVNLSRYIISGESLPFVNSVPKKTQKYKKIFTPKNLNKPKFQSKGLIFVLPKKKTFYYNKELLWVTWFGAHMLYWLHVVDLLPSGTAIPFDQPVWNYEPPLHKPKSRDFIIEPNWDYDDSD